MWGGYAYIPRKGIPSCGYAVYSLVGAEDSVNQGTSGPAKEHPVLAAEHLGPDPEPSGFDAECPTHGPASLKMTGTGLRLMIRWSLFPG